MGIRELYRRKISGDHNEHVATERQLAETEPRAMSKGEIERALGTVPDA